MKTILKENFVNGWYKERGVEIQEYINQYVINDKKKEYTNDDFYSN